MGKRKDSKHIEELYDRTNKISLSVNSLESRDNNFIEKINKLTETVEQFLREAASSKERVVEMTHQSELDRRENKAFRDSVVGIQEKHHEEISEISTRVSVTEESIKRLQRYFTMGSTVLGFLIIVGVFLKFLFSVGSDILVFLDKSFGEEHQHKTKIHDVNMEEIIEKKLRELNVEK